MRLSSFAECLRLYICTRFSTVVYFSLLISLPVLLAHFANIKSRHKKKPMFMLSHPNGTIIYILSCFRVRMRDISLNFCLKSHLVSKHLTPCICIYQELLKCNAWHFHVDWEYFSTIMQTFKYRFFFFLLVSLP